MLSINARKVLFSLAGIAIISFVVQLALVFLAKSGNFNVAHYASPLFQSAETIIVTILGILLGLVFEGAGRARYLGQAASNPALFDHVAKAYRIVLILGVIVGSIYLLLNIWVIYVAYTYGMVITITSAQESGTIIGIIRYIALALVFIWLSAEPQKDTVPPMLNVKKFLILSAIYCSMMAILNLFGLSMYKVSDTVPPSVQLSATSSVKAGK